MTHTFARDRGLGRIEAVIFDLDDTLLDWSQRAMSWEEHLQPVIAGVHGYLLQEGHLSVDSAESVTPLLIGQTFSATLRANWANARETWVGVSMVGVWRQTFNALGLNARPIDINAMLRAVDWRPMPGVVPYEDTAEILSALRAQGYRLGLITNSFQPMWLRDIELEAVGLVDYFEARITSGDTGFMKPHPAIYWRMLGLLNTTPERAVFVGDHPSYDIKGARLTGLTSVLICRPNVSRELEGNEPDFTIQNLPQLLPILEQLG